MTPEILPRFHSPSPSLSPWRFPPIWGFLKWWYPYIIHFRLGFSLTPSSYGAIPMAMETSKIWVPAPRFVLQLQPSNSREENHCRRRMYAEVRENHMRLALVRDLAFGWGHGERALVLKVWRRLGWDVTYYIYDYISYIFIYILYIYLSVILHISYIYKIWEGNYWGNSFRVSLGIFLRLLCEAFQCFLLLVPFRCFLSL